LTEVREKARARGTLIRVAIALGVAALIGLSIFGRLAYQAVNLTQVKPAEALARLDAARTRLGSGAPMIGVDASGKLVPAASERPREGAQASDPTRLEVLAYHRSNERLIEAHVPFWFLRLKGPAAEFALAGTGLDLEDLGLTADDLARHGPGLILDRKLASGDPLLVWIE